MMKQQAAARIEQDPRILRALTDLQERIREAYPEATFDVFYRDDPEGMRLRAIVDVEDTDAVMDLVVDQLYELQVEQGLAVYVIPVQPSHILPANRGSTIDLSSPRDE
jgi:hypothetical protein